MLMERRIPIVSFQPPNFQNKKYFEDSVKIADEIIRVMQPDDSTCFRVSSEYVLSALRSHLTNRGFNVQKVEPSTNSGVWWIEVTFVGAVRWECLRI